MLASGFKYPRQTRRRISRECQSIITSLPPRTPDNPTIKMPWLGANEAISRCTRACGEHGMALYDVCIQQPLVKLSRFTH